MLFRSVVVMNDGRISQHGSARHVFRYPENEFVARFIGGHNVFIGEYKNHDSNQVSLIGPSGQLYTVQGQLSDQTVTHYRFSVRTDDIAIATKSDQLTHDNMVHCQIIDSEFHGSYVKLHLQIVDEETTFNVHVADHVFQSQHVNTKDKIWAGWNRQHTWLLHST